MQASHTLSLSEGIRKLTLRQLQSHRSERSLVFEHSYSEETSKEPSVVEFSLQYALDSIQNTKPGHYAMQISQRTGRTEPLAFPIEVQAYQGGRISQFKVKYLFDDEMAFAECSTLHNEECFKDHQLDNSSAKIGTALFTIISGRKEVLLSLKVPNLSIDKTNREVFAVWTPWFNGEFFDSSLLSSEYFTDAQGFEIMKRDVYDDKDQIEFSKSFYPVDSIISVSNVSQDRALTVWNDRPQAGSVHSNF